MFILMLSMQAQNPNQLISDDGLKEPHGCGVQCPDYLWDCGLPGHPTLHPVNKSMLVAHNRASLLPKKGEGQCIPLLTCCLQQI